MDDCPISILSEEKCSPILQHDSNLSVAFYTGILAAYARLSPRTRCRSDLGSLACDLLTRARLSEGHDNCLEVMWHVGIASVGWHDRTGCLLVKKPRGRLLLAREAALA